MMPQIPKAAMPSGLAALLLATCLVGPFAGPATATAAATENSVTPSEGKRYALLVATGDYDEWSQLVNPVPDVRALGELLQQRYGFLAESLENPTREEILGKLRRYVGRDYGPNDQVLIAFAGHGTYDEVTEIGFLAARDSASRARDPNFSTVIGYPMLLSLIDKIPSPQVLLAVDACFSGSLAGLSGQAEDSLVRRFLTSGGTEYTSDGDPDRHSPFMAALLGALEQPGDDGTVGFGDLRAALSAVRPAPRSGRFGRDGGGELGFVASGAGARSMQRAPRADPPRAAAASAPATNAPATSAPATSSPASSAPARPRLRTDPAVVSENELKRAFQRLNLFEAKWSYESDFANEYRQQVSNTWDVVLDLESGLMWQRGGSGYRLSPGKAREYVQRLNQERHAGFSDWRLPTLEELGSLLESFPQQNNLYIDSSFEPEQEACWSSDIDRHTSDGYFVSFTAGKVVLGYGSRTAFARAVRTQ